MTKEYPEWIVPRKPRVRPHIVPNPHIYHGYCSYCGHCHCCGCSCSKFIYWPSPITITPIPYTYRGIGDVWIIYGSTGDAWTISTGNNTAGGV